MRAGALLVSLLFAGCVTVTPPSTTPAPSTPSATTPADATASGVLDLRLAPNDTWTYRVVDAEGNQTGTSVVRVRDAGPENATVETTRVAGRGSYVQESVLLQGSLALVGSNTSGTTARFDPPFSLYSPLANHTYHGVVSTFAPVQVPPLESNVTLDATITLLGSERVVVPAGAFDAAHLRIEAYDGATNATSSSEAWFVPALKAFARTVSENATEELTSYHVG